MRTMVTVHKLANGSAFMNVKNDVSGGVAVWGTLYNQPTFLLVNNDKTAYQFMQFEDDEWATEWFDSNPFYTEEYTITDLTFRK